MPTSASEMPSNAMPLRLESNQIDDSFTRTENDLTTVRLLSCRCQESRAQLLPSQDYACLIADARSASLSLCFCVCDGVGSSFMGGFAARYLATQLTRWLNQLETIQLHRDGVDRLHFSLSNELAGWARSGQAELSRVTVAPSQASLIQEVLEELRASHGSETVFCAGRIDYPAERDGHRSNEGPTVLLCWMGNVKATLFQNERDLVDFGYLPDDRSAWSTVRGLCGTPRLYLATLGSLDRLIVYTDGAESFGSRIADLDDHQLYDSALDLLQLPTSDDVTVLDVQWKKYASMLSSR
jgi:hypothetical protein